MATGPSKPTARPGIGTSSGSTAPTSSIPIRRRAFSRTGRTARRRSSIRRLSLDRRGVARRAARRPGRSTSCTSARSPAKARGRRPPRSCRSWRDLGITRHRADAGRRVRRPLRLGLRRRRPVRAVRISTARPTTCARFVDAAHALGLGVILDVVYNHLGPDGNYLRAFSPAYFTDRYDNEWGEALNFDGADCGAGARVLRRQRRLLDRRVPPRRPAPRRDAADLRRVAASTSWRRSAGARAQAASGRADRHRRRERAAGHAAGAADRRRAATASTRSGTTTSTTARWSR